MTSWKGTTGQVGVRERVRGASCEPSTCPSSSPLASRQSPSTSRPRSPGTPSSSRQSWGRVACWSHSRHWPWGGSASLKREKLAHSILHLPFLLFHNFFMMHVEWRLHLYQGAVEKVWSHQGFPPHRASSSRCKNSVKLQSPNSWGLETGKTWISYLQMTSLVCSLLLSMMDLYMITPSVASVSSPQETRMM